MEIIIKKNGKKCYREKIYVHGREIKSPTFERKTDAKMWHSKMKLEKSRGLSQFDTFIQKKDLTLEEFAETFLEDTVKPQLAFKTYLNYKGRLQKHIFPIFGKLKLRQISVIHGNSLIRTLKSKGHNPGGVRSILRTFKRLLSQAVQEDILNRNPFDNLGKINSEPSEQPFLSQLEVSDLLISNREHPYYPIILMALNTGMRKGEIGGLKWDCVDLENKTIEIRRTRDQFELKETTKTGLKRFVPMNSIVYKLLTLKKEKSFSEFVFLNEVNSPFDVHHLYRIFKVMQKNAKFTKHYRFHDLRHTFASHFVMNGGNLYELKKLLGHSKIEMTMRYAHLSPNYLKGAIEKISFI